MSVTELSRNDCENGDVLELQTNTEKPAPLDLDQRISVEKSARTACLRITEIFYSLQGETDRSGLPTVFVRLTGCPLRCVWCDTAYAFEGGERQSLQHILERVAAYPTKRVCVTGGEPLVQPACMTLMRLLCDAGYDVSLETSGALDVSSVDARVMKVMDLKAPDSGEEHRNRWLNVPHLTPRDVVKFVIASRRDFEWSVEVIHRYGLVGQVKEVVFSPVFGKLAPTELAEWVLQCGLDVRFQLQLHKILWGDRPSV
ncbi:MAG: 7-carboxy-7-deazaguanine synthase QueE [Gammaproteobacteria bacterium]